MVAYRRAGMRPEWPTRCVFGRLKSLSSDTTVALAPLDGRGGRRGRWVSARVEGCRTASGYRLGDARAPILRLKNLTKASSATRPQTPRGLTSLL